MWLFKVFNLWAEKEPTAVLLGQARAHAEEVLGRDGKPARADIDALCLCGSREFGAESDPISVCSSWEVWVLLCGV